MLVAEVAEGLDDAVLVAVLDAEVEEGVEVVLEGDAVDGLGEGLREAVAGAADDVGDAGVGGGEAAGALADEDRALQRVGGR